LCHAEHRERSPHGANFSANKHVCLRRASYGNNDDPTAVASVILNTAKNLVLKRTHPPPNAQLKAPQVEDRRRQAQTR